MSEFLISENVADLTDRELSMALIAGPGSATPEAQAAIEILCTALDGLLLGVDLVRRSVTIDGGRAYIDWSRLDAAGDALSNSQNFVHTAKYPVGVGSVVRIAADLGTGRITPSIARVIVGAFGLVADQKN